MKTRIRRIKRFCKAAEMIGFIYSTGEDDYNRISSFIHGNATIERIAEAINCEMQPRYFIDIINDKITRDGFKEYLNMTEKEFKKAFRQVQCYDYEE